jgi:hypothetical protein
LNKKRCEADVLRCVRRCQRGEYVFAPHAEIDRFLWHAREPFDDAQLTALSNLCEPSSSAAANTVDSDAVLAPLKAAGDLPTQGRARAGSVSSRLSTVFRRTASKPATPTPSSSRRRRHCRGRLAVCSASTPPSDNLKSQSRSRLASMLVRPQFNVTELAAADKQADLETERLLLKALTAKSAVELAREKTPPPPPPPLKQ